MLVLTAQRDSTCGAAFNVGTRLCRRSPPVEGAPSAGAAAAAAGQNEAVSTASNTEDAELRHLVLLLAGQLHADRLPLAAAAAPALSCLPNERLAAACASRGDILAVDGLHARLESALARPGMLAAMYVARPEAATSLLMFHEAVELPGRAPRDLSDLLAAVASYVSGLAQQVAKQMPEESSALTAGGGGGGRQDASAEAVAPLAGAAPAAAAAASYRVVAECGGAFVVIHSLCCRTTRLGPAAVCELADLLTSMLWQLGRAPQESATWASALCDSLQPGPRREKVANLLKGPLEAAEYPVQLRRTLLAETAAAMSAVAAPVQKGHDPAALAGSATRLLVLALFAVELTSPATAPQSHPGLPALLHGDGFCGEAVVTAASAALDYLGALLGADTARMGVRAAAIFARPHLTRHRAAVQLVSAPPEPPDTGRDHAAWAADLLAGLLVAVATPTPQAPDGLWEIALPALVRLCSWPEVACRASRLAQANPEGATLHPSLYPAALDILPHMLEVCCQLLVEIARLTFAG